VNLAVLNAMLLLRKGGDNVERVISWFDELEVEVGAAFS